MDNLNSIQEIHGNYFIYCIKSVEKRNRMIKILHLKRKLKLSFALSDENLQIISVNPIQGFKLVDNFYFFFRDFVLLAVVYEGYKFDIFHIFVNNDVLKHAKLFSFCDPCFFIFKFAWCPSRTFEFFFVDRFSFKLRYKFFTVSYDTVYVWDISLYLMESTVDYSPERDISITTTKDPNFDNFCNRIYTFTHSDFVSKDRSGDSDSIVEDSEGNAGSISSPTSNVKPYITFITFHPNLTHLLVLTRMGSVHGFHPDTFNRIDLIFFMPYIYDEETRWESKVPYHYYKKQIVTSLLPFRPVALSFINPPYPSLHPSATYYKYSRLYNSTLQFSSSLLYVFCFMNV
jgi:hypothetical protein